MNIETDLTPGHSGPVLERANVTFTHADDWALIRSAIEDLTYLDRPPVCIAGEKEISVRDLWKKLVKCREQDTSFLPMFVTYDVSQGHGDAFYGLVMTYIIRLSQVWLINKPPTAKQPHH